MKLTFYKMHGIGNDYIYFDCFGGAPEDPSALAVRLSDRHFSVGGDGVVLILPHPSADAEMRMFNADGSEGKMCGNAIRCVCKYLHDVKGIRKDAFTVQTRSGLKRIDVVARNGAGEAVSFRVDMGAPILEPEAIPALFAEGPVVSHPLIVGERTYRVTCLSMGNPHCVVFCDDPDGLDLGSLGPLFERHPAFPERVNTEFVRAGSDGLRMRVWERGSGETLACGTGACAAAVAAVLNGYFDIGREIAISLKGGELSVVYTGDTVLMTGPAALAFKGETEV